MFKIYTFWFAFLVVFCVGSHTAWAEVVPFPMPPIGSAPCPVLKNIKVTPAEIYVGDPATASPEWASTGISYGGSLNWKVTVVPDVGPAVPEMTTTMPTMLIGTGIAGTYTVTGTMPQHQMMMTTCPASTKSTTFTVKPIKVTSIEVKPGTSLRLTQVAHYKAVITPDKFAISIQWYYRKKGASNWIKWTTSRLFSQCEVNLGIYEIKVEGFSGRVKSEAQTVVTITDRPKVTMGPFQYLDHWEAASTPRREVWSLITIEAVHPPMGVEVCRHDVELQLIIVASPTAAPEEFDQSRNLSIAFAGKDLGNTALSNRFRYLAARGQQFVILDRFPPVPDPVGGTIQYARKVGMKFTYTLGDEKYRTPFEGHFYAEGLDLTQDFLLPAATWQRYALFKLVFQIGWNYLESPPAGEVARYTNINVSSRSFEQASGLATSDPQAPQRHRDLWP